MRLHRASSTTCSEISPLFASNSALERCDSTGSQPTDAVKDGR